MTRHSRSRETHSTRSIPTVSKEIVGVWETARGNRSTLTPRASVGHRECKWPDPKRSKGARSVLISDAALLSHTLLYQDNAKYVTVPAMSLKRARATKPDAQTLLRICTADFGMPAGWRDVGDGQWEMLWAARTCLLGVRARRAPLAGAIQRLDRPPRRLGANLTPHTPK